MVILLLIALIFYNHKTDTVKCIIYNVKIDGIADASTNRCAYICIMQNSKTCVKQPLSKRPKIVFKTNYRLLQVEIL